MKQLSKTKKTLIICLILNLVVWGAYGVIFWNIRAQNKHVSQLLNEANQDVKKDEALRFIKTSLSENKDFISHIDSYFVGKDGVVSFITVLESLGKESNVDLTIASVAVEPDGKIVNDFKELLRLKVQVLGSWERVSYFLLALESLPYLIKIDQASFTVNAAGDAASNKNLGARWNGYFDFTVLKLR